MCTSISIDVLLHCRGSYTQPGLSSDSMRVHIGIQKQNEYGIIMNLENIEQSNLRPHATLFHHCRIEENSREFTICTNTKLDFTAVS